MNIYTLPRTPGATETTEWTTFCHSKEPFLVVSHERFTQDYSAERKRPFKVTGYLRGKWRGNLIGSDHFFTTLAKAQAFAIKAATETENQ